MAAFPQQFQTEKTAYDIFSKSVSTTFIIPAYCTASIPKELKIKKPKPQDR